MVMLQIGQVRAKETKTGVVVESGMSGVVVKGQQDPEGIKYNTGKETVFTPSDYNPEAGDTVTLTYYPKELRSGEEILAVSALTLVQRSPDHRELSNPAEGTVIEVGRKMIRFNIPETGQEISMDIKRGMEKVPSGWSPAVGDRVMITYAKVRSRFGSKIVYEMNRLERLN